VGVGVVCAKDLLGAAVEQGRKGNYCTHRRDV
jgi:hypothetical protein